MSLELEAKVERLSDDVKELRAEIHDLVDAFNTARGVVKFVKVLSTTIAAVSAAVAGVWALFHIGGSK